MADLELLKFGKDGPEPGSLAWKIKAARKYHRPPLDRDEVARRTAYAGSTIGMYETGARTPSETFVERLAQSLGISASWFYDGEASYPPDAPAPLAHARDAVKNVRFTERAVRDQINLVPYWGTVPAGNWEMPTSDPSYIQITESVDPEGVIAVRVSGRSMEPRFHHGEVVVIKLDSRPHDGVISLARNESKELTLKLLVFVEGAGWELHSLNPEYGKVTANGWEVLGYAIAREEVNPAGLRP